MKAHYLQHVPFEGLGSIESWLESAGYSISCTKLFESADFPELEEVDLLIVMGGPMSVNDENEIPWLVAEKEFVRSAVNMGKPVLGICLGAQLIANALGAKVYKNSETEIGWFPVYAVSNSSDSLFSFPESAQVFHWHGETFDLPTGATLLASSAGCVNQAFQLGDSVIGLQFHLETTAWSATELVNNCRDELISAKYVQTEEGILSADAESYLSINRLMESLLKFITR
jgi:GMP synthase-like glutamine amidotransferase